MKDQERLIEALADRYAIEGEIGSGGMATVYLAHDLKHDRKVAVKVLDPDLAQTLGAERFLREIRTAANLTHPHILPLHDSGEAGGFLYYTMPFVKGESLRSRLTKETQLPVADAIQITREIAEALAYAHKEGIIHRDVKPANIMLEEGHAVLADFGVAQAVAQAGDKRITQTGISLGTPTYMSPEQATGGQGLDARTDQYALGCVLFEMLTGYPPFTGAEVEAVVRQHLTLEPPSVTEARPSVPGEVEEVIIRALAKRPADRFRTTGEMAAALGGTAPVQAKSRFGRAKAAIYGGAAILGLATVAGIASRLSPPGPELVRDRVLVIPFSNQTGDPSLDDFALYSAVATGIGLAQTPVVTVAPPEPVRQSWEARAEIRRQEPGLDSRRGIAEEFGAGILVEGAVLPGGSDSLRIAVGFMRADKLDDTRYLAPVSVPLEGREEGAWMVNLVEALAAALALHLDRGWQEWSSRHFDPPPSQAVWREMNACRDLFYRGDIQEALGHCVAASAMDSTYLPYQVILAVIHLNLGRNHDADSILSELEPSSDELPPGTRAQAQWLRAMLDGDRDGAYRAMKEGHGGFPPFIWGWGFEALRMNRPEEAFEVLSERLDPDEPIMRRVSVYWEDLAWALHTLEDHRRELKEAQRGRERHPDHPRVLRAELRAHAALGHIQDVNDLLGEILNRHPAQAISVFRIAAGELRAHGYPETSVRVADSALAYLKARSGQHPETEDHRYDLLGVLHLLEGWEDAYALAEELTREDSTNLNYLGYLGTLAAHRGDRQDAERISAQLGSMDIPYDRGNSTHWRARIAAILGDRQEAVRFLYQAHSEGRSYSLDLHIDPDLDSLRDYQPFEDFMRPKG